MKGKRQGKGKPGHVVQRKWRLLLAVNMETNVSIVYSRVLSRVFEG